MGWYDRSIWYYVDWVDRESISPPTVQWYCEIWAERHMGDSEQNLLKEIALLDSDQKQAKKEILLQKGNRAVLARRYEIATKLILVAKAIIAMKKNKPIETIIHPHPQTKPKVKPKPKPPETPSSQQREAPTQGPFDNKAVHDAQMRALEEALGNDPTVAEMKELQNETARQDEELNRLLDRAEAGDGYATNDQIKQGVQKLITDMHNAEVLRDRIETKYGVQIGESETWKTIGRALPGSPTATALRSIEVVEKRRIQSIGQKYGLGRQPLRAGGPPRRSDEEMRQDLTEILSMEKQRQLLGGEGDNGVTQVVAQMMRVDRGQIEMDIKMAQAEIQRRKGTITRQEIEQISQRLLQKVLGNERAQQMLGMSTEGTGAIIEQAASLQTP